MVEECYYYNLLMIFFLGGGREDEDKTRQENSQTWFSFKIAFFGHILEKINTFIFWCMVIPLGPHLVYTQ